MSAAGRTLSVVLPVFDAAFLVDELLRRLEAVRVDGIDAIEIVAVDDGSSDGTGERLDAAAAAGRIVLVRHPRRRGKGASLRSGIAKASGDFIVFQDADLEYDLADFAPLLEPLLHDGADAVYGSRFVSAGRRRVLGFRHRLGNRLLTALSNFVTDLDLTDMSTGAKAFRAALLKSIPLRSNGVSVEAELTAKVAKRRFRLFEVPVSFLGRLGEGGKRIGFFDAVAAVWTIFRFSLVDDLYAEDEYGSHILHSLEKTQRFNRWMAQTVARRLGSVPRVLEIGAGIGNMTSWLLPRRRYVASDINPNYLHFLDGMAVGRPYLESRRVDLTAPADFEPLQGAFDGVVCLNVLEHVSDPEIAVRNLFASLAPGGRAVIYVPQGQGLYSPLDDVLGHRCRYDRAMLRRELEGAGFAVESIEDFNRVSVPGWWWNGRVLRRRSFSRVQLKLFDLAVPVLRRIDGLWPWKGLGLLAVARRPDPGAPP